MTRATFCDLKVCATNMISRLRNRRAALVLALILCCACLVVGAHSGLGTGGRRSKAPSAPPISPIAALSNPPQTTKRESARVVKFSLFEAGIYPREVHVDKGLIAITIEDYSGGTAGLVIERQTGNAPEHLGRVERAGRHWRGKSEVRLTPGRYLVYMADRPANRALLVVEP